jgi:diacylglycerol kinase (ATP)
VLVVPCGSGNDCARALGLRSLRDSLAAWRRFSAGGGNVRTIDLGVITPLGKSEAIADSTPRQHLHYFCCVGGVGLDAEIARRANRLPRWLRANGGYALSFLPSLLKFVPFPMTILASPSQPPGTLTTRSAKPAILAAFANAPAYGGGMKIAPQAQMDDGRLDVCVIEKMDKLKLFCLFPTVYFGRHLRFAEVEHFQTGHLQLVTEMPLAVYADGEYVCQTPVEVTVAPKILRVIVPA